MTAPSKRVLLTGASGFIGACAIGPLLASGYEVHAIARQAGRHEGAVWHSVDLLDDDATGRLVRDVEAEYLLHLAWCTEHGRFWNAPENLDWAASTSRLLRAFREAGGKRAVVAGTCAEYDWNAADQPCRELDGPSAAATPERPGTLYGSTKQAMRLLASAYAQETGLSLAWGRIFLLYGPGEDPRRLVPSVARALLEGRTAQTTDGAQVRDFMHVEDVARAFAVLLDSSACGPVNVASGEPVSVRRVVQLVADAVGRPDLLRLGALAQRPGEPPFLVADTHRLRSETGFRRTFGLEDGIASTVARWRELAGA